MWSLYQNIFHMTRIKLMYLLTKSYGISYRRGGGRGKNEERLNVAHSKH